MAAAHCTAEDAPVRALSKLRCAAFVNRAQNDAIQTVDLRSVQFLSYTGSFFLGAPCHVLKHNSYFLPLTSQIVKSVGSCSFGVTNVGCCCCFARPILRFRGDFLSVPAGNHALDPLQQREVGSLLEASLAWRPLDSGTKSHPKES